MPPRSGALIAVLLTVACAHRSAPHNAKLVVQRSESAARSFVRATVGGHPLLLLVDTGASQSILPEGFVRRFKLRTRSNAGDARITDANGRILTMPTVPGVAVQFEGENSIESIDFIMNSADLSETEGILAPQDLVSSGWAAVIDYQREELRYEPEAAALRRLGGLGLSLEEMNYHSCDLDNHRVTTVTINGVPEQMMLDTGAERTALGRNSNAIPSMLSLKGKTGVTSGLVSTGANFGVSGVPVEFARTSFVLSLLILPASQWCGRGVLGADALSHCTLVWGAHAMWASCRVPPGNK